MRFINDLMIWFAGLGRIYDFYDFVKRPKVLLTELFLGYCEHGYHELGSTISILSGEWVASRQLK